MKKFMLIFLLLVVLFACGPEDKTPNVTIQTFEKGAGDKNLQEIADYINSYYKTRDSLYTPVVQVLYRYAKANIKEVI